MQAKIRDAQNQKIPYMLVVGDREAAEGSVNVRLRTGEQKGTLSIPEFKDYVQDVVAGKASTDLKRLQIKPKLQAPICKSMGAFN